MPTEIKITEAAAVPPGGNEARSILGGTARLDYIIRYLRYPVLTGD